VDAERFIYSSHNQIWFYAFVIFEGKPKGSSVFTHTQGSGMGAQSLRKLTADSSMNSARNDLSLAWRIAAERAPSAVLKPVAIVSMDYPRVLTKPIGWEEKIFIFS